MKHYAIHLRHIIKAAALLALWTFAFEVFAAGHPPATAKLETPFFRFDLWEPTGRCEALDKRTGVVWGADTDMARFGEVTLQVGGKPRRVELAGCRVGKEGASLVANFHPLSEQPAANLRVRMHALADQKTLEVSYETDEALEVTSISLLEDMFVATDTAKGYVIVPVREGLLVPADSGLSFTHRFGTFEYEGCHMEMLGIVEGGAAAMITWHDPYAAVELKSTVTQTSSSAGRQRLSASLVLAKSAKSFRVQFLGKGDYVTLAQAYRKVAQEKGWLVTWDEKLKTNPERAKLFGAVNYKLWSTLDRRMNAESTQEESVRVNWTFDESAQVAEHLKRDLKLDKVLFIMGGWIHRGYDNQHPDILPTAPECGGDTAFSDCARRVRNLGYLFCLHDNYQDIYRDSPSWDENLIMKTPDGKLARGGHWAGGNAYLTCSRMALDLARRPQNLPAVKDLSGADAYFIDTTYAAGLQECFDPAHPLTRWDDMKWKQTLSDYARGVFGIFGSECGREWAIPHSDFFEGLTGVSGRSFHDANLMSKLGATVVPLFDLVYRDCIAMYGKYGYNPQRAAEYVLEHISLARPLNYHSIPPHLYWKTEFEPATEPASNAPDAAVFARANGGWAAELHPLDRFVKNTYEILSPLNELTARMRMTEHQFLTPDRKVQQSTFGEGADAVVVVVNTGGTAFTYTSRSSGKVELPPYGFIAESRTFAAFHALSYGGLSYSAPVMFTMRSLDNRPLSRSRQVRVYHAFGSDQVRLGKATLAVPRIAIVAPGRS
ncbi:MAG: DUF5696 domain-containing protein [Limisphaerales bacterium]